MNVGPLLEFLLCMYHDTVLMVKMQKVMTI